MEQAPSISAPDRKRVPVPFNLLDIFLKANLINPQTGQSIISALGNEVYRGNYDIRQFGASEFDEAQFKTVFKRMTAAHDAHGIKPVRVQKMGMTLEDAVRRLWKQMRNRVLGTAANYCSLALYNSKPVGLFVVPGEDSPGEYYTNLVAQAFEKRPQLRAEVATLFELLKEAESLEEVQGAIEERRDLLNYRKHGVPVRGLSRYLTKAGRERHHKSKQAEKILSTSSEAFYAYIAAHAKERGLSIPLDSTKRVRALFQAEF